MAEAKKTVAKTTKKATTAKKATAKKAPVATPKLTDATYATGKRKDSVARVYLMPGKGNITVNGKPSAEYFRRAVLQMIIAQPFGVTNRETSYDIVAIVQGGGLSGQAGAVIERRFANGGHAVRNSDAGQVFTGRERTITNGGYTIFNKYVSLSWVTFIINV